MKKTTTEAEIRALVAQGKKFPEVARELGVNYTALLNACSLLGIKSPKRMGESNAVLFLAGIKAGKTLQAIANEHGISRQAVDLSLRRAGFPTCARELLAREHQKAA